MILNLSIAFLAGIVVRAIYEHKNFNDNLHDIVEFKNDVKSWYLDICAFHDDVKEHYRQLKRDEHLH